MNIPGFVAEASSYRRGGHRPARGRPMPPAESGVVPAQASNTAVGLGPLGPWGGWYCWYIDRCQICCNANFCWYYCRWYNAIG